MPLTPDELPSLVIKADELRVALDAALRKDKDGKVRFTPGEWRDVGKKALALGTAILVDWLD